MAKSAFGKPPQEWKIGESGPLHATTLFVDLVSSSDFASVLGLREYAEYVQSFHELCREQCRHFFQEVPVHKKYFAHDGSHYEFHVVGDELVVFLHTGKPGNDVYLLICLVLTLKCAWLGLPINVKRLQVGLSSTDLAAGIHCGRVWATRAEDGFRKVGFAINVAKRTESTSREGQRFRIMVSDPAFKQINRKQRNLLLGPRVNVPMKGIVVPVGVYEVFECFLDVSKRLAPQFTDGFRRVARQALRTNSFDTWIHTCFQVLEAARHGDRVTDECLELCEHVLNIDPINAGALFHAAQGMKERGDLETAYLYYQDLTKHWPKLADSWLEMGRLCKKMGKIEEARQCLLQARRRAVDPREEELPEK